MHTVSSPAPVAASPSPRAVISARDLTRTYTFHRQESGLGASIRGLFRRVTEQRIAVDAIDLRIDAGEVVGLLGPNGAGKTTTLKMLSGLLHPTAGEIDVLGFRPAEREVEYLRRIALVMGQKTMLWWDVPAMETFLLHREMYAIPEDRFRQRIDDLATMLEVRDLLGVQVRKLSLGERMKFELMAALLHEPDVIFLDEPTIGLDVVAKARVRQFLADVNATFGTTILITSHDMDDIEALCSRVVLIDHGRIAYDGALDRLVQDVQPHKLVRATYGSPPDRARLDAAHPTVTIVHTADPAVLALEVPREDLADVLATLPRLGEMLDVGVADAEVEEIIRTLFLRRSRPEVAV